MNYLHLIESLQFPIFGVAENDQRSIERIRVNTVNLQQSTLLSPADVAKYLIEDLKSNFLKDKHEEIVSNADDKSIYSIYSLFMLRKIYNNVDFQSEVAENLVSEKHKSIVIACMEDVAEYGLKSNLYPDAFYTRKGSIFTREGGNEFSFYRTELMVEVFSSLLHVQPFLMARTSQQIILLYMAAIFSLLLASDSKERDVEKSQINFLELKLQTIWIEMSKSIYYRNLMILYGIIPLEKQHRIYKDMLLKLWSSGGFVALWRALSESDTSEEQHTTEIVVKLVADPSYPIKAQKSLIKQILRFLIDCVSKEEMMPRMAVGLISLRKLYDNNNENKNMVKDFLRQQLQPLTEVEEDRLTVIEWRDFSRIIRLLFQMFCTSSFDCLPSKLLVCFLPLLIACHQQINSYGNQDVLCGHLSSLILKILNNRKKEELEVIIKCVALNSYPQDWLQKHPQVVIEEQLLNSEDLRIVQKETGFQNDELLSSHILFLAMILQNSSFNTLSYQIFEILFRLVSTLATNQMSPDNETTNLDLLTSAEIQNAVVENITGRYKAQFEVINALQILIQHKPLKSLITENIREIFNILQDILSKYTSNEEIGKDVDQSVIMILVVIIREIMENITVEQEDIKNDLSQVLKQVDRTVTDQNLKFQISSLQNQIQSNVIDSSQERFEEARSLIESNKPYIQVEGIQKFIKLIEEKDAFTVSSVHVVTALALNTLKSTESYAFLNSVRLFASLANINEQQVLEILADDYLNETAGMDYRLQVGEALLKVCRSLGQTCYKYKALLLNSYMCGCRSPLDEFRFSAFSNLAQMCRLLTYDVYNYFEELLQIINCELTTGKYMPAKRAAVMVLCEILSGMDNLFDYQEMLLPIYRLLKLLISSESCDEKIRLHASVGLECIAMKCKELLLSDNQQPLEKHIKILGIRDEVKKRNIKSSILYMN